MTKKYVLYLDDANESIYVLDVLESHSMTTTEDLYKSYHKQYPAIKDNLLIARAIWYENWLRKGSYTSLYHMAKRDLMNHKGSLFYPHEND